MILSGAISDLENAAYSSLLPSCSLIFVDDNIKSRKNHVGREKMIQKNVKFSILFFVIMLMPQIIAGSASGTPIIETNPKPEIQSVLVVPVYADDILPSTSIDQIVDNMRQVEEYYTENSYSKMTFHSFITGWLKLNNNLSSYVTITTHPNGAERVTVKDTIFTDALNLLKSHLDFSDYDVLVVIHSGKSDQHSFSHEGSFIGSCHIPQSIIIDGKVVFEGASIVAELDPVSVIIHELGHQLGANDLYDYLNENPSLGKWCIMSSGSSGMCGYTKESLGFIENHEIFNHITGTYRLTLVPLSMQGFGYRLVKHALGDGRILYIEGRSQLFGSDKTLPAGGVLAYIINETSIAELRGGNEVIWYNDTAVNRSVNPRDAILREGESIGIPCINYSIRFVESTDKGYIIDISTNIEEDWGLCDRIRLEDARPRDIDIAWMIDYKGECIFFAAIVVSRNGKTALQIYNSSNFGRDWILQYDSGDKFNVSINYNDFVYYDNRLWYIGRFQMGGAWEVGAGVYLEYKNELVVWNLTKYFNAKTCIGPVASCDSGSLYISLIFGDSNNRSFCHIRRFNDEWYSQIIPTYGEISGFDMSDPIESIENPWITFYNSTGKYIVRYNSSTIFLIDHNRCLDLEIARAPDSLTIVSHSVENGSIFLRIYKWAEGFETVLLFECEVSNPRLYAVFTGPTNKTWILSRDNNTLYLTKIGADDFIRDIIPLATYPQHFSAPTTNSKAYRTPLILHYDSSIVSTLSYELHPPNNGLIVLWYYYSVPQGDGILEVGWAVGIISLIGIGLVIVVIYIRRRK